MRRRLVGWSTRICLAAFMAWLVAAADDVTISYPELKKLYAEESTCSDAGFKGSFINECGYCVQGVTGLPRDFGRDCAGTCGRAYVDCAGKCNGASYIDECDGRCIDASSLNFNTRNALGPSPTVGPTVPSRVRDCRGLCPLSTDDNVTVLYENDGCGICIATDATLQRNPLVVPQPQIVRINQTRLTTTTTVSPTPDLNVPFLRRVAAEDPLPLSDYRDCSGTCFAPASVHLMAVNNSDTCFQCWGPKSSSMGLLDLKDECGHCRRDHIPCQCPLSRQDLCGVCNGTNNSCVTIVHAFPTIIPSDKTTNIKVVGVALLNHYSTVCMLIRKDIGPDGKDEDRFPAVVDGTNISCDVTLPQGIYELRLAVMNSAVDRVLQMSNTSIPFLVYSNSALFTGLSPSTVILHSNLTNFTVELSGQDLDRLSTVFCTIGGPGFKTPIIVESSPVNDSMANCTLPMPTNSFIANVNVSLDNVNRSTFAGPFAIRFITPAPYVTDSFFLPDGESLAIFFNRNINQSGFLNCGVYLTPSTVQMLGQNATCQWVTKKQLLISLGPSVDSNHVNPLFTNFTQSNNETPLMIVFKDNILRADNETYAEWAMDIELNLYMADELPIAVLAGPTQIPPCGKFVLDGHQSIHVQNRRVNYVWSVIAVTSNSTSQALIDSVDDANEKNLAWLELEAEMLDTDIIYTFTLTVLNSPNQYELLNNSFAPNVASTNVTKSHHLIPFVSIEPSLASYPQAVTVDQSFTLHSYVTMPSCQHEIFAMTYNWTFSNPEVKIDLQQLHKDSYKILPYSLPVGQNISITLVVTLNNDRNMSSSATITFETFPTKIKGFVDGGFKRFIGNESGFLKLNASGSFYPDHPSLPLVYRWECSEEGDGPCYDYDQASRQTLLLPQPIIRNPVLSIPSGKLRPNTVLTFKLIAISPLDSNVFSEPYTVEISTVNGSVPTVSITSLMPLNELVTKPEMEDMLHLIPSMTDIFVTAKVDFFSPISELQWHIEGLSDNFTARTTNTSIGNNSLECTLVIPRNLLISNGLYVLELRARDIKGREGFASEEFSVLPSVTGCVVTMPDYEAFKMVTVAIEHCAADDGSYPLSYQVHVRKDHQLISLSPPEFHLPLEIMGPPDMKNTNGSVGSNAFSVQVCDSLNNCQWFNSGVISVRASSDLQATAEHAFFMANVAKLQGDYLACLRRHVLYLVAVTVPYRFRHEMEYESQMAEAYLCARMAADVQCQNNDCFEDLFTFLTSITIENSPGRDFILMEVVERAVNRLDVEGIHLSPVGVQQALYVLENIYTFNISNLDILNRAVRMSTALQKILARGLHVGESSVLTNIHGQSMAALSYTLFNETIEVKLLPQTSSNKTVKLQFASSLKDRYSSWECKENSSMCHGMVAKMLFFPDRDLRPVEINENRTVSDVVEVALLNPVTGDQIDEETWVTVVLTANESLLSADLQYNCYSWKTEEKLWSSDYVSTDVVNKTVFYCGSDHPTLFAVIGSEKTLSAAEIVGIVLGVLGGLALIGLVAFFFYKKARTKSMRVSISKDSGLEMRG